MHKSKSSSLHNLLTNTNYYLCKCKGKNITFNSVHPYFFAVKPRIILFNVTQTIPYLTKFWAAHFFACILFFNKGFKFLPARFVGMRSISPFSRKLQLIVTIIVVIFIVVHNCLILESPGGAATSFDFDGLET